MHTLVANLLVWLLLFTVIYADSPRTMAVVVATPAFEITLIQSSSASNVLTSCRAKSAAATLHGPSERLCTLYIVRNYPLNCVLLS